MNQPDPKKLTLPKGITPPAQPVEPRLAAVENAANVHQSAISHIATVVDGLSQRVAVIEQAVSAMAQQLGYVSEGPDGEAVLTFPADDEAE